ncbi:MAG: COX15/CtaA family protein [Gemmatimonadota bacterium]|nr:COX15/CtaA family protein [Gemmatimonadota bacterium]
MIALRRLSLVALGVAVAHIVFGGIVRITGSGMGCGDHWPKCHGYWLPPLERPDLVIEWTHRLLSLVLVIALVALVTAAWRRRDTPGAIGRGGVLRAATAATALVIVTALFGAITVKLGNVWYATVVHWLLAAAAVAALAIAAIRAGALGGASARTGQASAKTARGAASGVGLALLVILLGGLTAKMPLANVACLGFPHCRTQMLTAPGGALHVQLTHRVLAFLLVLHLLGLAIASAKRQETPVVTRTARAVFAIAFLQILVAAAMVEMPLPPVLRSVHQTFGVAIWLGVFTLAYLARIASGASALGLPAR